MPKDCSPPNGHMLTAAKRSQIRNFTTQRSLRQRAGTPAEARTLPTTHSVHRCMPTTNAQRPPDERTNDDRNTRHTHTHRQETDSLSLDPLSTRQSSPQPTGAAKRPRSRRVRAACVRAWRPSGRARDVSFRLFGGGGAIFVPPGSYAVLPWSFPARVSCPRLRFS